jgi:hypothetical protein
MNGLVVRKGKEAGIPTPLNQEIVTLTKKVERGILRPGLENLPTLERLTESAEL